jgi:O-methyltransferase
LSIDDSVANTRLGFVSKRVVSWLELLLLDYYKRNPVEQKGLAVVRGIYARQSAVRSILFRGSKTVLFSPGELLNLWEQARIMKDHGGSFAEVGAYKGDSAEVVCQVKGGTRFLVFEAFGGLPAVGKIDKRFRRGMFASREADLRRRLEAYPNTTVIHGYFADSAGPAMDERFSYVHLDVDLYDVTLVALKFFYPRMLAGGRIISHDYGQCAGMWRAVDEFFTDKPEHLEPMGASQVMIIKK